MPKRTFQPNRRHRAKTHGFLTRMKTKAGAAVLSRRRAKGRHKIAVSAGFRDSYDSFPHRCAAGMLILTGFLLLRVAPLFAQLCASRENGILASYV